MFKRLYPSLKGDRMLKTNRNGEWFEIIIPEKWSNYTLEQLFQMIWHAPKKTNSFLTNE